MAIIHKTTTMNPGKLELLAAWLPAQPWYLSTGRAPVLARAGGFRLDDPEGEVGIEFMIVTDASGERPVAYHVPLTYRGAPLERSEDALIGTSEHGVLGLRWIYDGTRDPVLVEQLLALLAGRVTAQAQSESDTPDPTVEVRAEGAGVPAGLIGPGVVTDTADATVLTVGPAGLERPVLALAVSRVLRPGSAPAGDDVRGRVLARWSAPDAAEERGVFALLSESGR
ncbi:MULTISPECIES: 1,4-alpha-glucan branching protein [unclassified Streptomyces]|uniref:maltokinase N-terminal cap-like domain-containing protein n=1 Tax=unclassified Streptomyces TaxID=2593676 RepID=UPI001BE786E1|nr:MULTISPECIES: 1,4-alpha-glucan branching protein [unclassified Streptomyces]MBT2407384.1 1,4-alpha-glucan branching protein [Streptomyces sp. ISL-21]MBT2456161.1 1,4-alpha-glucan branching protein [Streptomyces sp. ISL-86]MBT2611063.1 1,4-alpha-glucan branching protein [Streptomyces sp. ISL-87]